jgi:hypothetical protein
MSQSDGDPPGRVKPITPQKIKTLDWNKQGRNIALLPLDCLKNGQADLPQMNGEYPKE